MSCTSGSIRFWMSFSKKKNLYNHPPMPMNTLIYCRVSSDRQASEGHGLDGQERRCRDYAKANGCHVLKVFRDEGASGGTIDRPALKEMFAYMKKYKNVDLVLFEDVSRIARDMGIHIEVLSKITQLGAKYQTVNQPIEDTAVGIFIVQSLANVAQLHRNLNTQNVISKMKARLESGHWTFDNPPGYVYKTVTGHGRLLVPDEPKASVIRTALEGFASGRFQTQRHVQDFLQSKMFKHRGKTTIVHPEQVRRILMRILYAGYIAYPKWGIPLIKGHHKPIISLSTFERIQERLAEKPAMPHDRKDMRNDFPLRGFVLCGGCGKPFTAQWSRGRAKPYPYYRCNHKECGWCGKSIRREKMEDDFKRELDRVKPRPEVLELVKAVLMDLWKTRTEDFSSLVAKRKQEEKDIEEKIEKFSDRIGETDDPELIDLYEQKIKDLNAKKLRLGNAIKVDENKLEEFDFKTVLDTVFDFIKNPSEMWNEGNLKRKHMVLRFIFRDPLIYDPKLGFRTPVLSLPIEISCSSVSDVKQLVEMPGIEPGCNV